MKKLPLVFLLACAQTSPAPTVQSDVKLSTSDPKTVVATIGSKQITAGEVEELAKDKLKKLNKDYTRQVYEARRGAVEEIVIRGLVGDEAKKKNLSEDEFLKQEVEAKAAAPTEAETKEFFDKNQDKMRGAPYAEIKPRIVDFLTNQKRQEVMGKYIEDLKKKNNVVITLQEPEEERVQVAAKGPSMGPADAKVTIVEFSDFQCPFCSKAKDTVDKVMATYKGKVRLVFRDYPLPFHDQAQKAAEAGQCANVQGKFWEMHDHMFANQSGLDVDSLKKAAKAKGLDAAKFDTCLDKGEFATAVKDNMKDGQSAGVEGTPHFFINGRQLSGAQPFEKFKEVIDSELARK